MPIPFISGAIPIRTKDHINAVTEQLVRITPVKAVTLDMSTTALTEDPRRIIR